jgi:hypothetical protein
MNVWIHWTDLAYNALTFIYEYTSYLLRAGSLPATFSSDKSVEFQRTTRPYVPENITPYNKGPSKSLKGKGIFLPADQEVCIHLLTLVPHSRIFYLEDGGDTILRNFG